MLKRESLGACGASGTFYFVCYAADGPEDKPNPTLLQDLFAALAPLKFGWKRRRVSWCGS